LVDKSALKDLLSRIELKQIDKLFLVLGVEPNAPKPVAKIRQLAKDSGLTKAGNWNISAILAGSGGHAVRVKDGWELTTAGREYVSGLLGGSGPAPKAAISLRNELKKITDANTRAFLSEAIECCERKLYRAAVVLSWEGALSLLYNEIVSKYLAAFNAEAARRDAKWRPAKNQDGLTRMDEYKFLEVIESLSVIGKNVKDDLQICLKTRNSCGHPNSFKLGEAKVAAHIESLLLNVFARFS
jgi:hypothetical protein